LNRRQFALLVGTAAAAFALPSAHATPQDRDDDHGNGHGHEDHGHDDDHGHGHDREHGNDHRHDDHGNGNAYGHYKHQDQRYFRDQDHDRLVRYYDGPRNLPPGLRKKYYRNGVLPPSWQQGFRPMPPQVVVELPPVPYGYQRGYYGGYAVVVDPRTRVIYDAIDIVGALSGH
jgi:Ni/Co efflux regulator RcnB